MGKLYDSYRPELHYMRGPGPKWREKRDWMPAGSAKERELELPYSLWLIPAAEVALIGVAAVVALA